MAGDLHNRIAVNNLAWSLALNDGATSEASALITQAIEFHGVQAALLGTCAVIYLLMGKTDLAITDASAAVADTPIATCQFHFARAYY